MVLYVFFFFYLIPDALNPSAKIRPPSRSFEGHERENRMFGRNMGMLEG